MRKLFLIFISLFSFYGHVVGDEWKIAAPYIEVDMSKWQARVDQGQQRPEEPYWTRPTENGIEFSVKDSAELMRWGQILWTDWFSDPKVFYQQERSISIKKYPYLPIYPP